MEVVDPAGRTWVVERRLIRLPRFRGFGGAPLDGSEGTLLGSQGGGLGELVVGILVLGAIALAIAFVWPLILLLVELLAAAALVAVRFLLGRWTVSASSGYDRQSWNVRGRRRSAAYLAEVADSIRNGTAPFVKAPFTGEPSSHVRVIRSGG